MMNNILKDKKLFRNILSIGFTILGISYIAAVTFLPVVNKETANTASGFIFGTLLSSIVAFYFGSSEGSKDKDEIIKVAIDNTNKPK